MADRKIEEVLAELTLVDAKRAILEKELSDLRIKNIGNLDDQKVKQEVDTRLKNRNKQFITAQSARLQAETTAAVKNRIAKFILETAKEGRTQVDFSTWGLCDTQLSNIVTELDSLGYKTEFDAEDASLHIKW